MIGKTVSHYAILEPLGGGGMGRVYRAEDTRLKRLVALKFLAPALTQDGEAKQRFIQEARAASSLDHPHVCTIHEIDETDDGQVFICMAHYNGQTLKARIAQGPLPIAESVSIATQVAEGLAQAHEHGIVHRDIKPANVMVMPDGNVKILDFGLAILAGQTRLTRENLVVGTVAYMSPEQARGESVDARTDLWSLGVIIFEMLTGRLPFPGEHEQVLLHAIMKDNPIPLQSTRADVPPSLVTIVQRCLSKQPGERYQSAAALAADLRRVRDAESLGTAPTLIAEPATLASVKARRRRTALAAGGGLALAAAIVLAWRPLLRNIIAPSGAPPLQHIAVLPLTNVGGDPENQSFCDGLAETLTSKLTQLERFRRTLWVVPASEVRAEKVRSASDARRLFGVNLAVTGSVQRRGNTVRLALNLVDAQTLRQVGSKVVDGHEADLSVLEDGVAGAMLDMLDVSIQPGDRQQLGAGGTKVARAFELYLQARGTLEGVQSGSGEPQQAVKLFTQAIALDPNFALGHAGLARAYLATYRINKDPRWVDQAVLSARRAAELDDQLAEVHITLGQIHRETGKYEDAVHEFQRALLIEPRNSDALTGLAPAFEALGRSAEAEATFTSAIALKQDYWAGYAYLGRFYYRHGRYEDAQKQFQKVISLAPGNFLGYSNLGAVYFALERKPEARDMFERAVAIKPNYNALSNLGSLYFAEKRFREAASMYERALAIDDREYTLWGNLGIAYHHLPGQQAKSRAAYSRAVELAEQQRTVNPRDVSLLIDLAGYYGMLGRRAQGLALLEQVVETAPTDTDSMAAIASSFEDLGERGRALEWFGKALRAGYPRAQIEGSPELRELRKDPRFAAMLNANTPKRTT